MGVGVFVKLYKCRLERILNCCFCVELRADDLQKLVGEVKAQLKKLAITSNNRKDRIFLGFDVGRAGCINRENLQDICLKHHLPCDNDIIDCVCTLYIIFSVICQSTEVPVS